MRKRFYLIRTKIDQDELSEKRRENCNPDAMLKKIRAHLYENVKDLGIREHDIFVISNKYTDKWDFKRLLDVTTKTLPASQTTQVLMNLSKKVVQEKVQSLRGT
jgi:predicted nucleotidyltransferase